MHRGLKISLTALALTAALTGCAGELREDSAPAATVTATATVTASATATAVSPQDAIPTGESFNDVDDMVSRWEVVEKTECDEIVRDQIRFSTSSVGCRDLDIAFSVYETEEDLLQQITTTVEEVSDEGDGSDWLLGPNWIISTAAEDLHELQQYFGGEVVTIQP